MTGPYDVTQRLRNLAPRELATLIRRILQLEAARLNLPFGATRASQRVNVGDEGEDGLIVDVPDDADTRLPPGKSLLQLKTTESPGTLKNEILKELRDSPRPMQVLREGGHYIVAWPKDAVGSTEVNPLLEAMQEQVGDTHKDRVRIWDIGVLEELCLTNPAIFIDLGLVPGVGVHPFALWARGQVHEIPNYVPDDARDAAIEQIRATVLNGRDIRIVHVQGDAGVGKSRILCEALDIDEIRDQVIVGSADSVAEFIRHVVTLPDAHCILLADETDPPALDGLYKAIQPAQGRIRLITAGLPGVHRSAQATGNELHLGPLDRPALLKLVTEEAGLPDAQAQWVAEISGGYPRLAVEVAKLIKIDSQAASLGAAITTQGIQQVLDRMLPGEELQDYLGVASLFSSIGVEGDRNSELLIVAEAFGLDPARFRQVLHEEEGRFVSPAGSLRSVTPQLVSVWLGSLLMRKRGSAIADSINELPEPLPGRFRDQLVYLREAPLIADIVKELLSRPEFDDPAGFDEAAAGFLRAAAAVVPEQVASLLAAVFERASDEELRAETFPRRNVVWTIEQLLWPAETYQTAASFLLRLAENENETFGNNATGVLVDSFQTYLGGTVVPYLDRLAWLDRQIDNGLPDNRRKLLAACVAAGLRGHQTRMHGSRPDEIGVRDWRPETWADQIDALEGAWRRLVALVSGAPDSVRPVVFGLLAGSVREALSGGIGDKVLASIHDGEWSAEERAKLAPPLRAVLKYDDPPEDWRDRIQHAVEELEGPSFAERIAVVLRTALWDLQEDDDDYQHAPRAVKELATQAVADESRIELALATTTELEDENTAYAFWREVAQLIDPKGLAERALEHDPLALAPYQAALSIAAAEDPEWVDQQLEESRTDPPRSERLVQLVQVAGVNDERAALLVDSAEAGEIPRENLAQLLYGAAVRDLSPDLAVRIVQTAAKSESAVALEHSLGILHQYVEVDPGLLQRSDVAEMTVDLAKRALGQSSGGNMASHYAYQLAQQLPPASSLAILEARILKDLSLPDPAEMEMLDRVFAEDPIVGADWAQDLLTRAVSPPYQSWAVWAENFHLLTRAAQATGASSIWEWIRNQDEEARIFLIRHIHFGFAEPDELLTLLIENETSEKVLTETSVAFSNSLGVVSGPYHLGLERQLIRLEAWRAKLEGQGRKWADRQIASYKRQIAVQRERDAEDEALRR